MSWRAFSHPATFECRVGSIGYTRLKIDGASLVTGDTPIVGSRLGVQATGPVLGGLLTFGVAQPLMIESGSAKLTYGTGYDSASQSLEYSTSDASLVGRRRVALTAGFISGGPRNSFRIGASHDLADGSVRALASQTMRF